jgi:predicted O-methyltransferase YrrM
MAMAAIGAAQIPEEFMMLLKHLDNPERLLEIGTFQGGSLLLFCQYSSPTATIISIDLPGGPYGGGYGPEQKLVYQRFAEWQQQLHLLQMNSHDQSTLSEVRRILGDQRLDFLFIDGDHTYEGVKADFAMYSPLVRRGGKIAFHDIIEHHKDPTVGVHQFWKEVRDQYDHLEFVQDPDQGWAGIGLVYK